MEKVSQPTVQPSVVEELCRTDLAHWKGLTTRVKDPVTARVIVQALDADPYLRKHRIGVYLAAAETVKRDQIRYARGHRYGAAVGRILKSVASAWAKAKPLLSAPKAEPQPAHVDAGPLVFPPILDPFDQSAARSIGGLLLGPIQWRLRNASRPCGNVRKLVPTTKASPATVIRDTAPAVPDAQVFPVIVDPFANGRRLFR